MKNQIERAEPSRGAPPCPKCGEDTTPVGNLDGIPCFTCPCTQDAAALKEAQDKLAKEYDDDNRQSDALLAENEKLRAGHVVLLEALRGAQQAFAAYDATMAILEQRLVNGRAVDDATQRLHKSIAANAANLRKEFNTRAEAAIQKAERT